ncbi:MAG TPA: chemotaxis protein CheA [Longimicrobium sp.]|nr:chemotaxis protein CheA [Longimicrobium sp.]
MDPGQFFGPFMDDYFAECDEHLASLRRQLLELEEGDAEPAARGERLRHVFRNLHTLKGLSGMVGFAEPEAVAHALEEWLRAAAPGGRLPPKASLDVLFEGASLLEAALNARREGGAPASVDGFLAKVRASEPRPTEPTATPAAPLAASAPPASALSPAEALRLEAALGRGDQLLEFDFIPAPELVARGVGVEAVRTRLGELGEIIHAAPRVLEGRRVAFHFRVAVPAETAPPEEWREDGLSWSSAPSEPEHQSGPAGPEEPAPFDDAPVRPGNVVASSNVVRVELARLDDLMRMVGELVISRSRLHDLVNRDWNGSGVPVAELDEISAGMERQLRELREGVMRVRLVPVGDAFERMRFVVRDVANAVGKDVRVELRGQDTELDKLVVERMMEPLLHLVRNAVSHGIETPAERIEAGKPPQGRLVLSAGTVGERVRMEVEDDGRGIDRAAVAERARAQGIAAPDGELDDAALLDVLCAPGFSTRDVADLASGRGVGMDVVRSTIRALGGELVLNSEAGRGTRFTVGLPLTLMIVDALLVNVGAQTMAVPQPALLEVIRVEAGDVVTFEANEVVRYRGRVLPILRLRTLFGIGGPGERAAFPVLVVGSDAQPMGLAVDRLAGLREIVVRSLSDPLVDVPGVAAATELGDGRVCLILDSAELVQLGHRQREARLATAVPPAAAAAR